MNRNGILMAIWILAAFTLVASLSMADRSDHNNRGGGGGGSDQAKTDHGNSHQATQAAPAAQAHTSSQPAERTTHTYSAPAASTSNAGRSGGSYGGWSGHSASQGSSGSSRWESTSRPTYTPQVSGNAGSGSWRAHSNGGATVTYQATPTYTPSTGSAAAQSWRSHTTGGNVGREKVSTSTDRPSFTQGSQTPAWKAGGDHTTFTPKSDSAQGQGSASGSWRDHVRGGTPSSGHTSGGVIAKPAYGPQGQGTFGGAQGDHRGRPEFKVNGQRLDFGHDPEQRDGHWAAPARPFFDRIGARMWEDNNDHFWHARRGDHEFRFRIGDRRGWFDGRECDFPFAPYLLGGYLYCPLDVFASYFAVPYDVEYVPVPYPVYTEGAQVGKGLAIATATEYLRQVGAYPVDVVDVDAHQNSAPANRFWDLVTAGRDPIPDAPMVWCWIVEFDYQGGWQQVFIDGRTGEVVGGSAS
jgi:hypothetical protein